MYKNNEKIFLDGINQWADFWHYETGVNVIPANTKEKTTLEKWSQWQDKHIPDELHEQHKRNGEYNNGIAVITGKIWRGLYKDKYLVAIDLDNKKAIEEFCRDGFEELKQQTLVEQHADPNKMHIYFIVEREIPKKTSDKVNLSKSEKIKANHIPALEVKSNGKGIMYCANSPHADGSNYQIIGTLKPKVSNAQDVENRIEGICQKYNLPYVSDNYSNNTNLTTIEDLWKSETKILEGHNRHLELLRIMDSLLARNRGILSFDKIKKMAYDWNQEHCIPPLDNKEFEKEWKQSFNFVAKGINSTNNKNTEFGKGNGNSHNDSNIQQRGIIVNRRNYFEFVVESIKKTVKSEDTLIRQILYTGFSAYVEDDPLNLGVLAPTSEGKTYPIIESLQYFPDEDVLYIGQMSPKVLVRQKGILIDKKSGEPLYDKVQELRTQSRELIKKKRATNDRDEQERLTEEIDKVGEDIRKLFEISKTLIDLRGKILVFLEPPQHELWNLLKPILSHDKKEIEFPFVDKTAKSNAETKDVVVRGFPACIFCSAKDESKWEIWNEIKSRILVTSPNMIQQKYRDSNKLIAESKGFPNLIQQQIIISDNEIETTKNCILLIKQKINELKSSNKNRKISLWIPFSDLLQKELPANKGTDVRFAKKIFSLLNIVPIVKSDLRMILIMEGESSIIADLEDLKEVLSITQNLDGLPKFKTEFFNDIFYPCFAKKTQPDSKTNDSRNGKNEKKEEEIIAITTRELCDYFREIRKKPITTDNLKHTYLNQLINEGIIDYTESRINARQNIYYPLVTESLSIESIMNPIDKDSQQSSNLYEKITRNITEGWIFHEIIRLIRYRLDHGNIPFVEYLKYQEELQIWGNNCIYEEKQHEDEKIETTRRTPLTISEFIEKYVDISSKSVDNKPSNILIDFAKRSLFLSILAKIDSIGKKGKKLFKCYHCSSEYQTKEEYTMHCHSKHPKLPMYPELSLIELMGLKPQGNPWESSDK